MSTPTAPRPRSAPAKKNMQSAPLAMLMRRMRIALVLGLFIAWILVIAGRLFWLQVVEHHKFVEEALGEQQRIFEVAPHRGVLYDRDLHPLAISVYAESVYAVPYEITDKAEDARILARIVHLDPLNRYTTARAIDARMHASHDFAWVARRLNPDVYEQVKALKLKGVYFVREFKRYYPDQTLAAQVLGYVGSDEQGLGGLEYQFNKQLSGTPGRMVTALDARRHVLASKEIPPKPGENLVLTIDANIQYMAEKALEENMQRVHALHGTIVVQDPYTGQILALANSPNFNPNNYRFDNPDELEDWAVSDVYEPGSTFKLVVYSAALNQHLITPQSPIPTLGGQINVFGRIVHDDRDAVRYEARYHNVLTASQALWQSSDVAAIELAERMGKDEFYHYIRDYGFGRRTGISLPGETRGLVKPPDRWQPTTIGSIPMGQEIGITPLQLIAMASTIANGGVYLPPHIVMKLTEKTPRTDLKPDPFHPEYNLPNPLPPGAHRVISELAAAQMRRMMEGVVLYGTGIPAQLNGYSAAGKTGTAEKIDPRTHTYSKTNFVASFVGFAPVNNPAVTIAVVMDSPEHKYHFGTLASAPVFRKLAQEILEYLGIPHDEPVKTEKQIAQEIKNAPVEEPQQQLGNMNSLFAEINHLPADDPLREQNPDGVSESGAAPYSSDSPLQGASGTVMHREPVFASEGGSNAVGDSLPVSTAEAAGAIHLSSRHSVQVPSFLGESVRDVVEQAGAVGLGVQVLGSGTAKQQVPAAGTKVPEGTQVVVRFEP